MPSRNFPTEDITCFVNCLISFCSQNFRAYTKKLHFISLFLYAWYFSQILKLWKMPFSATTGNSTLRQKSKRKQEQLKKELLLLQDSHTGVVFNVYTESDSKEKEYTNFFFSFQYWFSSQTGYRSNLSSFCPEKLIRLKSFPWLSF